MRIIQSLTLAIAAVFGLVSTGQAQTAIWYPLPQEAYAFGKRYPEAQRLLFAFDYGHALVYEKLLNSKGKIDNPEQFEKQLLSQIMRILKDPPAVKVDEEDIAPQYVHTFPMTVMLFDWSHLLHQFVLDVLATSQDRGAGMVARVNQVYDQYKTKPQISIVGVCKTMEFMDGHYFSKGFRKNFPSFNLLIWSYHWFQIRLYEALLKPTLAQRDQAVAKTVKEFWGLLSDLPDSADFDMMPSTFAEAPTFSRLFPDIAASFDNNNMLHDIVSDILLSNSVNNKRLEGLKTARMALDPAPFRAPRCGEMSMPMPGDGSNMPGHNMPGMVQ